MRKYTTTILIFLLMASQAGAVTYFEDDFETYNSVSDAIAGGWAVGSKWAFSASGGRNSSKCLVVHAQGEGATVDWSANHDPNPSGDLAEAYVRFYFKIENHTGTDFGTKFFKMNGQRNGDTNYANYTVSYVDYAIGMGDGSGTQNDATCRWDYDGVNTGACTGTWAGYGIPTVNDGQWHYCEVYFKYNTDGNYDGAVAVWYDGVKVVEASGIRNRHDTNIRNYGTICLFEYVYWGALSSDTDQDWYLYYDDIVVSDAYIGADGSSPSTPTITGVMTGSIR